MVAIYTLNDPTTGAVRYVGKTTLGLKKRLGLHLAHANRNRTHSAAWIRSLKRQGQKPIIEELDLVSDDENWEEVERYWINFYRSLGYRLTNHSTGGSGGAAGLPRSTEWATKIGEANRGSRNGMAKLTEQQVKEIRVLLASGKYLQREIAEQFGVSRRLIGMIKKGIRWKQADDLALGL